MSLRPVPALVCTLSIVCVLWTAGCDRKTVKEPIARNVVLVVIDTLRADRLGCYGYPRPTSPTIDALARSGRVYVDNRAQGTVTITSMISMMTGLYVTEQEEVLPPYRRLLAERVAASGRETVAVAGNQVLFGNRGFHRGFDEFHPIRGGRSGMVVDEFRQWLTPQRAGSKDGFFAWLHFMDPHTPYNPPPHLAARFATDHPMEDELVAFWRDEVAAVERTLGRESGSTGGEAAIPLMLRDNNLYDAEVASADEGVKSLLAALRDAGCLDDTLIILAADHGEELYERVGYEEETRRLLRKKKTPPIAKRFFAFGHGWSFDDSAWRTPLILAGPGIEPGGVVESLTANLDIFPTVLDAFGITYGEDVLGHSLLEGKPVDRQFVFGYTNDMIGVRHVDGEKFVDHRARVAKNDLARSSATTSELFDLTDDPAGRDNLATSASDRVERYRSLIAGWRKTHSRTTDTTLTDEDIRALTELGYIDG